MGYQSHVEAWGIIKSTQLSSSERMLVLALAHCQNDETGECFPSVAHLSVITGLNRKTVMSCLRSLEVAKILRIDRLTGSGNTYSFLPTSTEIGTSTKIGTSTEIGTATSTEIGTATSTEIGTPVYLSSTEIGTKQYQNRDTNIYINNIAKKTPIPTDFKVSESVQKWAKEKGHTRLQEHLEHFIDVSIARAYKYADWDRAFMNAIRSNWAKVSASRTEEEYL